MSDEISFTKNVDVFFSRATFQAIVQRWAVSLLAGFVHFPNKKAVGLQDFGLAFNTKPAKHKTSHWNGGYHWVVFGT